MAFPMPPPPFDGILVGTWNIGWNADDTPLYNNSDIWLGINLHNNTRARRRKPLVDGRNVAVAEDDVDDDDVDKSIDMEISSD